MAGVKLNDTQMQTFIRDGFVVVNTALSGDFHAEMFDKIENLIAIEGNPGNNILARIPELQQVIDDPYVDGALSSIMGDDYYTDPHRHAHFRKPHTEGQKLHKDSFTKRRHHNRWMVAFYYPQNTPVEIGPTGIIPGSQYRNVIPENSYDRELPLAGPAGRVAIANYDIVHRGMSNTTDNNRYMVKFLFNRMTEPTEPTWDYGGTQWVNTDNLIDPLWRYLWDWHRGVAPQVFGTTDNGFMDSIRSNDEDAAFSAAYSLMNADSGQIDTLIEILTDESAKVWVESAASEDRAEHNVGGDLRSPPGFTVPSAHASYALSAIGESAVEGLLKVLETAAEPERNLVVQTLSDMGPRAQEAIPALSRAVRDESAFVRAQAVLGLGLVSQGAQATGYVIPALIGALEDGEESVRKNSALAIAQLSEEAENAVPALSKVLSDTNRYVIGNAVEALARIGTDESHSVLFKHLQTARWCPRTYQDSLF